MPKSPPPVFYRWLVLVIISLAMFGNYYVYDCISPLAKVLSDQLGFTDANIGLLQAIYSLPNIFMVLLGGIIIDRIGGKKASMLFSAICLIGAILTAITPNLYIMATGRLIFGLGAESLIVAITTLIAKWFRGKELSFAFGINLTIARLGSFSAQNSPTWAADFYNSWQWPLLISVIFAAISTISVFSYRSLENSANNRYEMGKGGSADKVELKEIFRFDKSYWLIVALCVTFYSGIFPFQTFAQKLFQEAHGASPEQAGFLSSIIILFSMICTPIFGLFVDKIGHRALLMAIGSALLIPVYLLIAYGNMSLYIPMAMMGIAFSLIPAVMWPSVAYLVDGSKLGTAYGLMTLIQNIGLAGFNLMIGWSNDHWSAGANNPAGYTPGLWIFSIVGVVGMFVSILLWIQEKGPNNHGLELPKPKMN